jgi:catechol 2,3-dioxygenase-like lactoylglutathione lyase family enzyme
MAISLDVPLLDDGIAFYQAVFGLKPIARPMADMALIADGEERILLLERAEGTRPFKAATTGRSYQRHWTPVHLDFHVADVVAARDRALAAGARLEAWHEPPGRAPVAFMSDPFGHGFCLIGEGASSEGP